MADYIAIIDHGEIVSLGTVNELKQKTNTNSLEEAYLKTTGKDIREEMISDLEKMRIKAKKIGRK